MVSALVLIRIELSGFKSWMGVLSCVPGQDTTLSASLHPAV